MNKLSPLIFTTAIFLSLLLSISVKGQEPPQKSPSQIASEQADRYHKDLKLNDYQLFIIDSVLQTNLNGVTNEFERMKKGGMQNPESYREVQKRWQAKTDDAFERVLTLEQFDRYLKLSGMPNKERKAKIAKLKGAK